MATASFSPPLGTPDPPCPCLGPITLTARVFTVIHHCSPTCLPLVTGLFTPARYDLLEGLVGCGDLNAGSIKQGAMTQLVEALDALHLEGELSLANRWVKLQGEQCWVYVVAAKGGGYFTWCDDSQERTLLFYRDPIEAIQAGLRRALHTNFAVDQPGAVE